MALYCLQKNLLRVSRMTRINLLTILYMSHNMRFPTMLFVRPAKPPISLRICGRLTMSVKLLSEHYLEFLSLKGD